MELTQASGYNAIGLYMEHRFAYPSTPWAHGAAVVTPEMVRALQEEFPDVQLIPFLNLLGHHPDYGAGWYHYAMARKESGDRAGCIAALQAGLGAAARSGDSHAKAEIQSALDELIDADE